ncbi:hypothetical protein [Streptomyces sp. NPDC053431]|uniref:hypothetical protein n=1 Tax=Streptomyces sp. NPDC053431 TaxID=3365703 RepID=UPI0037CF35AF
MHNKAPKNPSKRYRPAALALVSLAVSAPFSFPAAASSPSLMEPKEYVVRVSFRTAQFTSDECSIGQYNCTQIYGMVSANNSDLTEGWPVRRIGLADSESCSISGGATLWNDPVGGSCRRWADNVQTFNLAETLARTCTYDVCTGSWKKKNNSILLHVKPGQAIRAAATFRDYDELSSDDVFCKAANWKGPFTADQLKNLNSTYTLTSTSSDGGCQVQYQIQTEQYIY